MKLLFFFIFFVVCSSVLAEKNDSLQIMKYFKEGNVLYLDQDFAKASSCYNKALLYCLNNNANTLLQKAKSYRGLGACYYAQNKLSESIISFKNAIQILEILPKKDSIELYNVFISMGLSLEMQGDFFGALNYFNKAENLKIKSINYTLILNNKGLLNMYNGDYDKALSCFLQAFKLLKNNEENQYYYNLVNNNLGMIYYLKKQYPEAINYLMKSIKTNNFFSPIIYYYLALCYQETGKKPEAELNFNLAMKLINKNKVNINLLPLILLELGKLNTDNVGLQSINIYNNALDESIRQNGFNHPITSKCFSYIGNYYYSKNEYQKAVEYFHKALNANTDSTETNLYNFPTPAYITSTSLYALFLKSKTLYIYYLKDGNKRLLYAAFDGFEKYITNYEKLKQHYSTDDNKILIAENIKSSYYLMIDICFKLHETTHLDYYKIKAFEYAEQSKAFTLKSQLKSNEILKFPNVPVAITDSVKKFKKDILLYRNYMAQAEKSGEIDKKQMNFWNAQLLKTLNDYDKLKEILKTKYTQLYTYLFSTESIDVKQLQRQLSGKETIIEYALSDTVLYSFFITNNKLDFSRKRITNDFFEILDTVIKICNTSPKFLFDVKDVLFFSEKSGKLYMQLLQGHSKDIIGKNITIIPDAQLTKLPFEILLYSNKNVEKGNFVELSYLQRLCSISYAYAAEKTETNFLSKRKPEVLIFSPTYEGSHFENIETSVDEIESVEQYFNCRTYEGLQANKKLFSEISKNYPIIHLTQHGQDYEKQQDSCGIIFSKSSEGSFLPISEIYYMELKPDLLVLSACQTGGGQLKSSEGILSVSRAFCYAGCKSIVQSAWNATRRSNAEILKEFYKNLSEGKTKDDALKKAKIRYLKNATNIMAHPFYWAGTILYGNTTPACKKNNNLNYLILLTMGCTLFIASLFFMKYRRRK